MDKGCRWDLTTRYLCHTTLRLRQRIANSVRETPTPSSASSTPNDPVAPLDWMDDTATRQLLASLGMIDGHASSSWPPNQVSYTDGIAGMAMWPDGSGMGSNYGMTMTGMGYV